MEREFSWQDVQDTLSGVSDEHLDGMQRWLIFWIEDARKSENRDLFRFWLRLRSVVLTEMNERKHGLWSLREQDLLWIMRALKLNADAAADPSASPAYGPTQFWKTALFLVDEQKRERWADREPGEDLAAQVEKVFRNAQGGLA